MRAHLRKLVERCITELGEDAVTRALVTLESGHGQVAEKDVLTIIANAGVHRVPGLLSSWRSPDCERGKLGCW